jgi:hypothetical protein
MRWTLWAGLLAAMLCMAMAGGVACKKSSGSDDAAAKSVQTSPPSGKTPPK